MNGRKVEIVKFHIYLNIKVKRLFTYDEFIKLLDNNDPQHAELIRWLGNEFIIGGEYKFYFMEYEYVFEEKYYLYPYNYDAFI